MSKVVNLLDWGPTTRAGVQPAYFRGMLVAKVNREEDGSFSAEVCGTRLQRFASNLDARYAAQKTFDQLCTAAKRRTKPAHASPGLNLQLNG